MRCSKFLFAALAIASANYATAAPAGRPLSVAGPLGDAFILGIGACITAEPNSVLSGQRSIKAEYWGGRRILHRTGHRSLRAPLRAAGEV
jgi:hypothetical protein